VTVPQVPGETLLETARRAAWSRLSAAGRNCGTCMARLAEGMRPCGTNDALDDDEVPRATFLLARAFRCASITVLYE